MTTRKIRHLKRQLRKAETQLREAFDMDMITPLMELHGAWGVPIEYIGEFDKLLLDHDYKSDIEAVSAAANWYPELTGALTAMVNNCDHRAITEWADSDIWHEVERETTYDWDEHSNPEYAEDVSVALLSLADYIRLDCK